MPLIWANPVQFMLASWWPSGGGWPAWWPASWREEGLVGRDEFVAVHRTAAERLPPSAFVMELLPSARAAVKELAAEQGDLDKQVGALATERP